MAKEQHRVTIEGVDEQALGYARIGGLTIATPGTAVGDDVEIHVEHKSPHQNRMWGRVVKVHGHGPDWRRPPCHHAAPVRGDCGGCPLMHLAPEAQARHKAGVVNRALRGLRGFEPIDVLEAPSTAEGGDQWGYRNRSNYFVFRRSNGRIHLGSRAPRSHRPARMEGCLVNQQEVEAVANYTAELLTERRIPIHPIRGGIRYVGIRANVRGEVLVELIANQRNPGWLDNVAKDLLARDEVVGVTISMNRSTGNAIRVEEATRVAGEEFLADKVGDHTLWFASDTFFQLNRQVAGEMYRRAAQWAQRGKVVWDLYCGVGGLGIHVAAANDAQLFACELNRSATHLAQRNVKAAGLSAKVETINLRGGKPRGWKDPDVILVNPPRRGLDGTTKKLISDVRPQQLIYMSCSPASLADDLNILLGQGYRIARTAAWDMLPQTEHVEVLVALERETNTERKLRHKQSRSDRAAQDGPRDSGHRGGRPKAGPRAKGRGRKKGRG